MNLTVKTTVEIELDEIAHLLDAAFHGSGYWARIDGVKCSPGVAMWGNETYCDWGYVQHALSDGASVTFIEDSGDGDKPRKRILTLAKVKRGLTRMAKQYPSHFAGLVAGQFDAETGDVFLQLCLLGDVVYG